VKAPAGGPEKIFKAIILIPTEFLPMEQSKKNKTFIINYRKTIYGDRVVFPKFKALEFFKSTLKIIRKHQMYMIAMRL
jgi:hypothetical protein